MWKPPSPTETPRSPSVDESAFGAMSATANEESWPKVRAGREAEEGMRGPVQGLPRGCLARGGQAD
ncbi:hypothetical protein J3458_009422 [Metarhizium acridum]|uniref:uncharacterized protein n=1 Tax=Metarhizium acridum TaxID=92637 RepID=UPI001C6B7A04|nr:hypothetical protein J3458_009422 [Metarhizium acridum]